MRTLKVFMMVTLDGFFCGPHGEIDWHVVDEEFQEFANEQLASVDTLLFGRVTYQGMASYWPTPMAQTDDPIIAHQMNTLPKIVVSRTLTSPTWENTRLVNDHLAEEIAQLKQQPGKDLIIFGSSVLSASLLTLGLIDELRIMVNPVVLGSGRPVFQGIPEHLRLTHCETRTFRSGNVLLLYRPA